MKIWDELQQIVGEMPRLSNYCSYVAKLCEVATEELLMLEKKVEIDEVDFNEIDEKLDEIEKLLASPGLLMDYYKCKKVLQEGELIDIDGSYVANLHGEKVAYKLPAWREIIEALTPEALSAYKMMKDAGWDPHLQMTPVGMDWAKAGEKLAMKYLKADGVLKGSLAHIDLIYEPNRYFFEEGAKPPKPSRANPEVKFGFTGGISKDEYVRRNNGWLIEIVPLIEKMPADPEILPDPRVNKISNAEQIVRFDRKWRSKGYYGLGIESYITAALMALKNHQRQLDLSSSNKDSCSFLTEVASTRKEDIIMARMHESALEIHPNVASSRFKISRFRPSWRIKTPESKA
jgi:hypothetical protein